ncbi:MAG: hypothetical protein ACREJR_06775, partial [Candidatus Rokuibacteriota bacterium]
MPISPPFPASSAPHVVVGRLRAATAPISPSTCRFFLLLTEEFAGTIPHLPPRTASSCAISSSMLRITSFSRPRALKVGHERLELRADANQAVTKLLEARRVLGATLLAAFRQAPRHGLELKNAQTIGTMMKASRDGPWGHP